MRKNPAEMLSTIALFAAPRGILVATDLTDAEHLLPHAIAQANASEASVYLVYAIPPSETIVPEAGAVPYIDPAKSMRDAHLVLEGFARQVREHGLRCVTIVRHGYPPAVVAKAVEETGVGRVIVATHGRKGIQRLLLGSAAREILRSSAVPVCAIGPKCEAPRGSTLQRLLHPTALRPEESSMRLALDLARRFHAELTLLHVLSPPVGVEPYLDPQYAFEKMQDLLRSAQEDLSIPVQTKVVSGDVSDGILEAAREIRADMIVMGVHSTRRYGWPANGRTAYSVLVPAPCPVLALTAPLERSKEAADIPRDFCIAG